MLIVYLARLLKGTASSASETIWDWKTILMRVGKELFDINC